MAKLPCNIAMYHPDLKVLSARYRPWHVEEMLDQASTLIERCLQDLREYASLDYAWNVLRLDLRNEEKEIDILRKRESEIPYEAEPAAAKEEPEPADDTEMQEGAASEKIAAAEAPAPPSEKTITRLDLRTETARQRRELAAPGQPFSLDNQRDLTLKRLCRDYEEAVNRAWVAEQGLTKIYDHTDLPSPLPTEAETLSESITNLAIWIRDAAEWLARYQQHEEAFTRVISVRSLLGRNAWALLKHSRDSYSLKFRVPPELFKTHDNCHLRGIGASLVGEAGTVPWSMVVRLPDEAVYARWGQTVELDQSGRVSCLLGRIENRRSPAQVEICGARTLLNASPIGQDTQAGMWTLDIFRPPGASSESFSHIEDIVLEMRAVGIPQRSMS